MEWHELKYLQKETDCKKLSHCTILYPSSTMVICRISPWANKQDKLSLAKFTCQSFSNELFLVFIWQFFIWFTFGFHPKKSSPSEPKLNGKVDHPQGKFLFHFWLISDFPSVSSIMDALLLKQGRSFETGNISRFHKGKLNIHYVIITVYICETFVKHANRKPLGVLNATMPPVV